MKYVSDNSKDVRIDLNALKEYAMNLDIKIAPYWLNEIDLGLSEKEMIILVFVMESMNFCFFKEPHIKVNYHGREYKKSSALFYSVVKSVEEKKLSLDIDKISLITRQDLINILGGYETPFLDDRYHNLMETVSIIGTKKEDFFQELYNLNTENELLNYIVKTFPSFNDVSYYNNQEIDFYKRATLLVRDLFEVSKTIRNNIKSIDNLLAGADYGIPRTLRDHGVLVYSNELSDLIDNETYIEANSDFEVEIRANMIYAMELIKENLSMKIRTIDLDHAIWLSGRDSKSGHHRTISTYY